jgi:hypothetical protein
LKIVVFFSVAIGTPLCAIADGRVEALSANGDGDKTWVAMTQQALLVQAAAQASHHYLSALAEGQPADSLPLAVDVSGELVRLTVMRRGAREFERLLGLAKAGAETSEHKAQSLGTRLRGLMSDLQGNHCDLPAFTDQYTTVKTEQAEHHARAKQLCQAVVTARVALTREVRALLGNDLASLRMGIREAKSRCRQQDQEQAAELARLSGQLNDVHRDLELLSGAPDQEPGKIGIELLRRRAELTDQIATRRQQTASKTTQSAADVAERAAYGDAGALCELVSLIRSQPLAFEAGLADSIVETMAASLAESGSTFAGLL